MIKSYCLRQLGGLGVLRGVIHGFSEEARTRGFPSPPFGGFGFVVIRYLTFIRRFDKKCPDGQFGPEGELGQLGFDMAGGVPIRPAL